MTRRPAIVACAVLAGLWGRPAAAQITESFSSPQSAQNGSALGACGQLTVSTAGSGTVTVSGNGAAAINTASVPDAAIIHSTSPLPATYKVTVQVNNVAYHKGAVENGVTALTIASGVPTPGSEADWLPKRLVGVEIDAKPYFTDDASIFVNYWDAGWNMYTWDGSQWGAGDPAWKPYYPPKTSYEVSIEKTASDYIVTVSSGGTQMAQASVAVSQVMPAAAEYLVVGDRLVDFFAGSMDVESITMPTPQGCTVPPDSGTQPLDAGLIFPDALEFPQPEAGSGWPDGMFGGDGQAAPGRPGEPSACDCRFGARGDVGAGGMLGLLLLLVCLRRRQRWRFRASAATGQRPPGSCRRRYPRSTR